MFSFSFLNLKKNLLPAGTETAWSDRSSAFTTFQSLMFYLMWPTQRKRCDYGASTTLCTSAQITQCRHFNKNSTNWPCVLHATLMTAMLPVHGYHKECLACTQYEYRASWTSSWRQVQRHRNDRPQRNLCTHLTLWVSSRSVIPNREAQPPQGGTKDPWEVAKPSWF